MPHRVHYLRRNQRVTACGRPAKTTKADTRLPTRVTCRTCKRIVKGWVRNCRELTERA